MRGLGLFLKYFFIRSPGSRIKRPRSSCLPWFILGRMKRKIFGHNDLLFLPDNVVGSLLASILAGGQ